MTARQRASRVGIGALVLAVGAVISGAALLSPSGPDEPPDDPTWTVAAPADVQPGAPVVTLLGIRTDEVVEGSEVLELDAPPAEATHVRIAVTCLTAGTIGWGFDPANTPSMSCSAADVPATAWEDVALTGSGALHVLAAEPVSARIEYQYATHVPTEWGTNAAGETFGTTTQDGDPDLIAVVGFDDAGNPVEGYARSSELDHAGLPAPRDPGEAAEYRERLAELAEEHPDGLPVPVYESDGVTRIGTFFVHL